MMTGAERPLVIVTRKLPERIETRMRELFDTRLNLDDKPMTQAELAEAAKTADVLVPTITDRIDAAVLAKAAIRAAIQSPGPSGIAAEKDLFVSLFGTHDQREGMHAFLEKRAPRFGSD
jgi:glyoxylate reductase